MKSMILVCVIALAAFVSAETYTDKYDNTDVHEVIQNHRLLGSYVKCMLGQATCTNEGKELRAHLQDAIANHCSMCTDIQKEKAKIVISHLINNEPTFWNDLVAHYDPDMKHSKQYETELKQLKAH